MTKQKIHTESAPQPIGIYSQAIKTSQTLYLSGQIPLDPQTMEMAAGDFSLQVKRVLMNMQVVCEEAGFRLNDIVKLTVYLTDISKISVVNEIMGQFFQEPYPARTSIQVSALPKGAEIEIDAIAVV